MTPRRAGFGGLVAVTSLAVGGLAVASPDDRPAPAGLGRGPARPLAAEELPPDCAVRAPDELHAWRASAHGLDALARGEPAVAYRCLRVAAEGLPDSEVVLRDLAVAAARLGRGDARALLERAEVAGAVGGHLEAAVILDGAGEGARARARARRAGGPESVILSAALDDAAATLELGWRLPHLAPDLDPLARLVLARSAARSGAPGVAARFAAEAVARAERALDPYVANAARAYLARAEAAARPRGRVGLRVLGEHLSNPAFSSESPRDAFATRLGAFAQVSSLLGPARVLAGVDYDHRLHLNEREALSEVERAGVTAAARAELPLSTDATSAVLAVDLRGAAVGADAWRRTLGLSLEAGPSLTVRLSPRWQGSLGVYGVWTDFEEVGLRDLDRDRVGQRARLGVDYRAPRWRLGADLTLLHDDAVGQVLDATGLGLSVAGALALGPRWDLGARLAALARRWGPIGDASLTGEAERRTDLRLFSELRVGFRVGGRWTLVGSSTLIHQAARSGRAYTHHAGALGTEWSW